MAKPNLSNFFKSVRTKADQYSPEILMAMGLTSMVTTIVLTARATPKVMALIEEKKEEEGKDKLTPVETIKTVWKPCVPVALSAGFATACFIGSNSVHSHRNAALATAYKISETAFTEYKEKVIETIGEKKEQAVKDKVAEEQVKKNEPSKSTVIVTGKGSTRVLDAAFGRVFASDIESIKRAVNELNRRMRSEMYISLNEFYNELGLDSVEMGDDLGWNIDNGYIDIDFSAQLDEDGTPIIVMMYQVAPRYDFSKLL